MGRGGDEPPEAGRAHSAACSGAPVKHRRRKRRGKRTRWPSLAKTAHGDAERGGAPRPSVAGGVVDAPSSARTDEAARPLDARRDRGERSAVAAPGRVADATADFSRSRNDAPRAPREIAGGGNPQLVVPTGDSRAGPKGRGKPDDVGNRPSGHRTDPLSRTPGSGMPDEIGAGAVAADQSPSLDGVDRQIAAGQRNGNEPLRRRRTIGDPPLYAALDLGTNNCRLLVAEPWQQSFRVVDAFSRIVRLGEGLSRSGRLSDAAQDRAIEALRVCRGKLDARGIVRARLVATEACRSAENGLEFLARVEEETGLSLEVLTRETEARLAVAGCANLVDWRSEGVLLFDIGGGSSELVWLDLSQGRRHGGDPTRHIRAWTSLPVGVVTLSERHGGHSVDPTVFEDMVADVTDLLARHADWGELDDRLKPERWHMLGTSGTVTTLAGVHLGLKRYDRRRVDGTWLADSDVGAMIGRLLAMDFEDRVANPCIGGDRADLVLAGCAILEAIRRRWRCDRLRVADRGLLEGMLTELMIGDGVWRRPDRWHRRP